MKNLYELVKLDPTLKDNRDDKRMRKRNEVYNLAIMKLDSWIKMTLISEDAEIEMKQAILDLVRGYGFISVWIYVFEDDPEILRQLVKCFSVTNEVYFDENGRVKEVIGQISVIVTNIDNQNEIYYNSTIPTIKYQITQ